MYNFIKLISIFISTVTAGFVNGGIMKSNNLRLNFPEVENTGTIQGVNELIINSKKFKNSGTLEGGIIMFNGIELAGSNCRTIEPNVRNFFEKSGAILTQYESKVSLSGTWVIAVNDVENELADEINANGKCSIGA